MRTAFASVLVVLACLIAAPAVAAFAVTTELTEQDRYLAAVTPLADEPAVRDAVADQLIAALGQQVPESARSLVDTGVRGFVESDEFRPVWVEMNATAHPQLLAMLRGQEGSLSIQGDAVVLDLGALAADVKARLVAEGVPLADQLPDVDASVQVLSASSVSDVRPTFELMETLSVALPIVAILLLVAGVAISARRGSTLIVAGVGLVVAMLLLLLVQWLARSEVTARAPSAELAGAFYDAITERATVIAWIVCAVGGVAVIVGGIVAASGRSRREAARPPARRPAR